MDYQDLSTKDVCRMPFQLVLHGEYYLNKKRNTYQSPLGRIIASLSILKSRIKKWKEWN